jgi:heat shock protein HslJ
MSTLKVNNIVAYSGTHVSGTFSGVFSGSFDSSRIDALEAFSSSLDNTFATDLVVNSLSGAFNSFTAALDNTYATDAQLFPILQATRSIELTTGSLIGITNGLMAFTAALDSTYATDEQLYQLYQATASLQQFSSSIQSEVNAIKAWTASLELINTIDTELLQILQTTASLNSKTGSYATTGSNVFSGNQTISDSLIVSEIVSTTAPAEGDIASAGETGITYLTGDLTKWAIFREDAFIIGVWTDVVAGWAVTDNNGFTDIIAGRGSFGAASFQTTANNWPAPASGRTYVFTSPDYQPESANPLEITIGNNDWVFGIGGDLDVPANINGAPNLATTGSNTFVGNQTITGSLNVTGSVNIDNVIKLTPVTSFPSGEAGMLVASASYGKTNLYMYDGSDWKWLVTGSIA